MAFADGTCGRLAHLDFDLQLKVYQVPKISLNFPCCIRSVNIEIDICFKKIQRVETFWRSVAMPEQEILIGSDPAS